MNTCIDTCPNGYYPSDSDWKCYGNKFRNFNTLIFYIIYESKHAMQPVPLAQQQVPAAALVVVEHISLQRIPVLIHVQTGIMESLQIGNAMARNYKLTNF